MKHKFDKDKNIKLEKEIKQLKKEIEAIKAMIKAQAKNK